MSNHNMPAWKKRQMRHDLWKKSQLCGICNRQLPGEHKSTLDHIVPLSKGGENELSNMQLTHSKCNNKKGNES